MGIKDWIINKLSNNSFKQVDVEEIIGAMQELYVRDMAFETCVNMISNAVGKCKVKTFRSREPTREKEYYLWNVRPNANQNSVEFMHRLIKKLYTDNEVLVVSFSDGRNEQLYIADSFTKEQIKFAGQEKIYTGIVVDGVDIRRQLKSSEVIHLTLNDSNAKNVIDSMYESYKKLMNSLTKNFIWKNGKHLKVNVSQIPVQDEEWLENFHDIIENQVKPFLENENAVLPEFSGYAYEFMESKDKTNSTSQNTRDIRAMIDDIYSFTANAFGIPAVLLLGDVAGTEDAMSRWLTTCIDPLCDQISKEITSKRYSYKEWSEGNYVEVDTSAIMHFDLFGNAANVEKLIGSGIYSIDDVRESVGLNRLNTEWSKEHYMTLNITSIEKDTKVEGGGNGEK